jgi:hypothetical protein
MKTGKAAKANLLFLTYVQMEGSFFHVMVNKENSFSFMSHSLKLKGER